MPAAYRFLVMVRTHSKHGETSARGKSRRHSRDGKIATVLQPQFLADTDLGDLLRQQESIILKRNLQEAACDYTRAKAINR